MEYIAQDNPERAKSFAVEIKAKIDNLAEFPAMGRPGRVLGTRELVVHENYVIPYRVRGGAVVVVRVQHAAKRWSRRI
ncbi:MAG: type II toxin-antitoxin system RelE/ParE family toxin [Burkholderiales bacterium]